MYLSPHQYLKPLLGLTCFKSGREVFGCRASQPRSATSLRKNADAMWSFERHLAPNVLECLAGPICSVRVFVGLTNCMVERASETIRAQIWRGSWLKPSQSNVPCTGQRVLQVDTESQAFLSDAHQASAQTSQQTPIAGLDRNMAK